MGLTHPTGIQPLIGVITTRRLIPDHTAVQNLYRYFPHHLEHQQCDNDEPSLSDEESSPSTTTYLSAKGDKQRMEVEAIAMPPHTTSPTLDYGEWPLLTDDKL